MKGLILSRRYYEAYGIPMLHDFPAYEGRIAVGLAGEGSECLGFDDQFSRDHDWGPGFCMWLTDQDYREIGDGLQKAYEKLPKAFHGEGPRIQSDGGAGRVGVLRISDFYRKYTGLDRAPASLKEWGAIPESYLATAVNGEVFRDDLSAFSGIRQKLLEFYPEDIRLKKIAARGAIMAQGGQYNYPRCRQRGEKVAAALALGEFTEAACSMVYLLNKRYMPFYKWAHHGLKYLPVLSCVYLKLEALYASAGEDEKQVWVEDICRDVINELRVQKLTDQNGDFLLEHCGDILSRIKSGPVEVREIMRRGC